MSSKLSKKDVADLIQALCVVVVDDNQHMRKMIRTLLVNCGIKDIYEAADGIAALDVIRTVGPDVVILDWEMPLLSGAELVRIVRSPGVFPIPDVPIIMLSAHGERWRVIEAVKLGVPQPTNLEMRCVFDSMTAGIRDLYGNHKDPADVAAAMQTSAEAGVAPGGECGPA